MTKFMSNCKRLTKWKFFLVDVNCIFLRVKKPRRTGIFASERYKLHPNTFIPRDINWIDRRLIVSVSCQ